MDDHRLSPTYDNLVALWDRIESVRCGLLAAIQSLDGLSEAKAEPSLHALGVLRLADAALEKVSTDLSDIANAQLPFIKEMLG